MGEAKRRKLAALNALPIPPFPQEIKQEIAKLVRSYSFTSLVHGTGGCMFRALIAHEVFSHCGIEARLTPGALCYRIGPHPVRDVLMFCKKDRTGGFYGDDMYGHIWNEVGDDLCDFSSGDWHRQVTSGYDPQLDTLGPLQWQVTPPEFIWLSAPSLKSNWQSHGAPALGEMWYGKWSGSKLPNYHDLDDTIALFRSSVEHHVKEAELAARIAALR